MVIKMSIVDLIITSKKKIYKLDFLLNTTETTFQLPLGCRGNNILLTPG